MRYLFAFLLLSHFANAQTRSLRTYDGAVNDRYPVSLTLTTDDNLAYGTLVYKRSGIPIRVVGTVENGTLLLHEFNKESTITGVFNGKASAKGYLGSWFAPSSDKELTFSLTQTSQQTAPPQPTLNLTGNYAYNFGKNMGFGQLYVQQLGGGQVVVAMEGNRGAPSYNMASIQKTTLRLRGNQLVYSNKEYGKCTLKITFSESSASVVYVGNAYDCGFGNGATVIGNYIRTGSKVPVFPKLE